MPSPPKPGRACEPSVRVAKATLVVLSPIQPLLAQSSASRRLRPTWKPSSERPGHGIARRTPRQSAQHWLSTHFSVVNPVEQMLKRSKLAERTFKRRFVTATGLAPIAYVQRLRIEDAKKRLERTDAPVDEISWRVGYEDPAFFRRLFKRTTGLAPAAYRKRFRIPDVPRPTARSSRSASGGEIGGST